ncbi:F0F1 ATP synthase subunit A [Phocaeicola oris]|uniref:F0F1 ATP synthase subunit A n=1 Tax=Phocaeicola oris TaxID=2896850 RepID=UPI00234F68FC|nr:F0F1 ATP synthase subunit A [Phocaeicola oris]MCE2615426.1 F0F1 ATP synthase subunit A [Phocaeicola oris]
MNKLRYILIAILCLLTFSVSFAQTEETPQQDQVNATEIVKGHITDSYEWHITKIGETDIVIPLPVIVYSGTTGWHVFSSSHLYPEGMEYEGFHIATEGDHIGKIVETIAEGEKKPLDISITKTVLSLLINSLILILIILGCAHWYKGKKAEDVAPKGFVGFMEMFIMMIENDVIKACVGKEYKKYSPYLLTAFFFIFVNNVMGIIPIFPGGANVTGNIAVTLVLALCTFVAVNVFGNKEYWKDILWPEVPMWLKVPIPIMPAIEIFGIFTKPFALMIRLFANITAGHSAILALVSIIFVTATMGAVINGMMSAISILLVIFMNCLELLVAFIQAYVFTMLSSAFIGLSRQEARK